MYFFIRIWNNLLKCVGLNVLRKINKNIFFYILNLKECLRFEGLFDGIILENVVLNCKLIKKKLEFCDFPFYFKHISIKSCQIKFYFFKREIKIIIDGVIIILELKENEEKKKNDKKINKCLIFYENKKLSFYSKIIRVKNYVTTFLKWKQIEECKFNIDVISLILKNSYVYNSIYIKLYNNFKKKLKNLNINSFSSYLNTNKKFNNSYKENSFYPIFFLKNKNIFRHLIKWFIRYVPNINFKCSNIYVTFPNIYRINIILKIKEILFFYERNRLFLLWPLKYYKNPLFTIIKNKKFEFINNSKKKKVIENNNYYYNNNYISQNYENTSKKNINYQGQFKNVTILVNNKKNIINKIYKRKNYKTDKTKTKEIFLKSSFDFEINVVENKNSPLSLYFILFFDKNFYININSIIILEINKYINLKNEKKTEWIVNYYKPKYRINDFLKLSDKIILRNNNISKAKIERKNKFINEKEENVHICKDVEKSRLQINDIYMKYKNDYSIFSNVYRKIQIQNKHDNLIDYKDDKWGNNFFSNISIKFNDIKKYNKNEINSFYFSSLIIDIFKKYNLINSNKIDKNIKCYKFYFSKRKKDYFSETDLIFHKNKKNIKTYCYTTHNLNIEASEKINSHNKKLQNFYNIYNYKSKKSYIKNKLYYYDIEKYCKYKTVKGNNFIKNNFIYKNCNYICNCNNINENLLKKSKIGYNVSCKTKYFSTFNENHFYENLYADRKSLTILKRKIIKKWWFYLYKCVLFKVRQKKKNLKEVIIERIKTKTAYINIIKSFMKSNSKLVNYFNLNIEELCILYKKNNKIRYICNLYNYFCSTEISHWHLLALVDYEYENKICRGLLNVLEMKSFIKEKKKKFKMTDLYFCRKKLLHRFYFYVDYKNCFPYNYKFNNEIQYINDLFFYYNNKLLVNSNKKLNDSTIPVKYKRYFQFSLPFYVKNKQIQIFIPKLKIYFKKKINERNENDSKNKNVFKFIIYQTGIKFSFFNEYSFLFCFHSLYSTIFNEPFIILENNHTPTYRILHINTINNHEDSLKNIDEYLCYYAKCCKKKFCPLSTCNSKGIKIKGIIQNNNETHLELSSLESPIKGKVCFLEELFDLINKSYKKLFSDNNNDDKNIEKYKQKCTLTYDKKEKSLSTKLFCKFHSLNIKKKILRLSDDFNYLQVIVSCNNFVYNFNKKNIPFFIYSNLNINKLKIYISKHILFNIKNEFNLLKKTMYEKKLKNNFNFNFFVNIYKNNIFMLYKLLSKYSKKNLNKELALFIKNRIIKNFIYLEKKEKNNIFNLLNYLNEKKNQKILEKIIFKSLIIKIKIPSITIFIEKKIVIEDKFIILAYPLNAIHKKKIKKDLKNNTSMNNNEDILETYDSFFKFLSKNNVSSFNNENNYLQFIFYFSGLGFCFKSYKIEDLLKKHEILFLKIYNKFVSYISYICIQYKEYFMNSYLFFIFFQIYNLKIHINLLKKKREIKCVN
ncbi:hypothetical protein PGAL8A_00366900 [Plasmodium gallinaceum]|uniref:Uncharacterized protein n=1 Tax=Plasmodium gallinaceum TaxID=5849 RepID=A0A1J1GVU2_PLAGA|nr:hypothetical protein PGAL8A_00366900 [Plasmodium gallinaceum]CRG96444.1 hypothetical protein PGAL8A_00366900 [Plasmodium gallinaceum]